MTQVKRQKYPKYWRDERSEAEKIVTQRLAEKLSEINHKRHKGSITFHDRNHLFILIGGVPPNPNQFIGLKFPGKVINYRPPFFQAESEKINKDEKKLFNVSMDNTCEDIKSIIEQKGFKQAIFVYHSFGGSITAWFCSKYPQKIQGLICLGGTPIRFYPIIKDYTKAYLSIPNITRQFIIQNYEVVYSLYDQKTKNQKSWTRFKSKEQLLSFTLHNDPNTLNNLFDKIRALPLPILMIYGNNDEVLTKSLCAEAMVFMSYLRQRSEKDSIRIQEMARRFSELEEQQNNIQKKKAINLQQKLVYFIDGGHSIHISQKNNQLIQKLIDEYLYVILGKGEITKNRPQKSVKFRSQIRSKL